MGLEWSKVQENATTFMYLQEHSLYSLLECSEEMFDKLRVKNEALNAYCTTWQCLGDLSRGVQCTMCARIMHNWAQIGVKSKKKSYYKYVLPSVTTLYQSILCFYKVHNSYLVLLIASQTALYTTTRIMCMKQYESSNSSTYKSNNVLVYMLYVHM